MEYRDDELTKFEAEGAPALPAAAEQGQVVHDGARIWYATLGAGARSSCCMADSAIAATGATRSRRWPRRAIASS